MQFRIYQWLTRTSVEINSLHSLARYRKRRKKVVLLLEDLLEKLMKVHRS